MKTKKLLSSLLFLPLLLGVTSFNNKNMSVSIGEEINKNNAIYKITGYDTCILQSYDGNETNLNIPSSINYKNKEFKVTEIGCDAFASNDNIFEVNIPSSVNTINQAAFAECRNLYKITLPETFVYVDLFAFVNTNVQNLYVNDGYLAVSSISSSNLQSLEINNTINNVPFDLTYSRNLINLKKLSLPKKVDRILLPYEDEMELDELYINDYNTIVIRPDFSYPIRTKKLYFNGSKQELILGQQKPNSILNIYMKYNSANKIYYKNQSGQYEELVA